jgi:hypothetical protein
MDNTDDICNYFSISTHQGKKDLHGKKDLYSIIKIVNTKCLNRNTIPEIKEGFINYFNIFKPYEKDGCTKHALDLVNIVGDCNNNAADSSFRSAILFLNKLSIDNGYGEITLINCQKDVKGFMAISRLDTVIKMYDIKEL